MTTPTSPAGSSTTNPIAPPSSTIMIGVDSVPIFNGTGKVDEFIESIEQSAILGNWSEAQKLAVARLKLKGLAKSFFEAESGLKTIGDWEQLKDLLQEHYKKRVIPGQALREFLECKQRFGENCRDYLTRLRVTANRTITYTGDDTHDRILRLKLEEDTIRQFVMGLLDPVRRRVLSAEPATINEALTIAEREETIEGITRPPRKWQQVQGIGINSQNYRHQPREFRNNYYRQNNPNMGVYNQRNISQGTQRGQNERRLIERNETRPTQRPFVPSNIKCFLCSRHGHIARQCNAARRPDNRRCYACNQQGHLIKNCPGKRTVVPLNDEAATLQPRGTAAPETAPVEW